MAALCYSTLPIFATFAYRGGATPIPLLGLRFIIATFVLGIFALRRDRNALKVPRADLLRYAVLGIGGFGASSLCYFYAIKYTSAPVVAALLYAYPAFVAIGAGAFFKESIKRIHWLAIAITIIGCALAVGIVSGGITINLTGVVLGLLAALAYAGFNLLSQRWLPGRSSRTMMTYVFGFSGLAFAAISFATMGTAVVDEIVHWNSTAWLSLAGMVVLPSIAAILLYLRGVRKLGAAQAAVVCSLEPMLTVGLSWVILNQALGTLQLLGVALIVAGVTVASLVSHKVEPTPNAPLTEDELLPRPDAESDNEDSIEAAVAESPGRYQRGRFGFWFRLILGIVGGFIVLEILLLGGFFWLINSPLPDITIENIADRSSQTTYLYAADGTIIGKWHGDEERIPLQADEIPSVMCDAVVAIEDRRFYEHAGVDPKGILRALRRNAEEGVIKQGGSTITQQVIKMLYVGDKRSYSRKIQEALMATRAEMGYEKKEILASYLNMAYFGQGAYGVESAAKIYFNKSVGQLSVNEAAMLAGLVRSPGAYDAFKNPGPVLERRNLVLKAMREEALIDQTTYERGVKSSLGLTAKHEVKNEATYPFFTDYVRRQLVDIVGQEKIDYGGLKIYTTIDPKLQSIAEDTASRFKGTKDPEVSVVSVRYTDGDVLAMVGGRDWGNNQFNLATQGKRQPGSSFKPFVLAAALKNGVPLSKRFSTAPFETPVKDGIWKVSNFSDSMSSGSMTLTDATVWSVNTVYARLIMDIGPKEVVKVAKSMGITDPLAPDPAIALGGLKYGVSPLEMASAYGIFGYEGQKVIPTGITRIVGRDGKVIYESKPQPKRVLSAKVCAHVGSVLHQVVERGTGQAAALADWSAGKTGTTQSYRDAWFVGWSNQVSTAVWMGYPEGQKEMTNIRGKDVTGGSFPAEMWAEYMSRAKKARPAKGFALPEELYLDQLEITPAQPE